MSEALQIVCTHCYTESSQETENEARQEVNQPFLTRSSANVPAIIIPAATPNPSTAETAVS